MAAAIPCPYCKGAGYVFNTFTSDGWNELLCYVCSGMGVMPPPPEWPQGLKRRTPVYAAPAQEPDHDSQEECRFG